MWFDQAERTDGLKEEEGNTWLGCSSCPRWYCPLHKYLLPLHESKHKRSKKTKAPKPARHQVQQQEEEEEMETSEEVSAPAPAVERAEVVATGGSKRVKRGAEDSAPAGEGAKTRRTGSRTARTNNSG